MTGATPTSIGTPPPPPPAPPKSRTGLWAVIGVIVVVVVIVLALAAVGVIPLFKGGSSSSGGGSGATLTYNQAAPLANGASSSVAGEPWVLVAAAGFVSQNATSESTTSGTGSGCTITLLTSSASITIPGGATDQTSGAAGGWLFLYENVSSAVLVTAVVGGQATAIGTIASSTSCGLSTVLAFLETVPANVIDSSAAASAVRADAAAFLSAHTIVTQEFALIGGVSFLGHGTPPEWEVNYTTCPLMPADGTVGASFNATVNATSGAVMGFASFPDIACAGSSTTILLHAGTPNPLLERAAAPVAAVRRA